MNYETISVYFVLRNFKFEKKNMIRSYLYGEDYCILKTPQEIEEYREEMEWDDNEAKKSNKPKRKCDCDFVGCQGC